jgi:hypothetical protein
MAFHFLCIMVAHCRIVPLSYHCHDFVQGLIWFLEKFLGI